MHVTHRVCVCCTAPVASSTRQTGPRSAKFFVAARAAVARMEVQVGSGCCAACGCAQRHAGPLRPYGAESPDSPVVHSETDQLIPELYGPLDAPGRPFCERLRGRVTLLVGLLVRRLAPHVMRSAAACDHRTTPHHTVIVALSTTDHLADLSERLVLHPRLVLGAVAAALGHRILSHDARRRRRQRRQSGGSPRDPRPRNRRRARMGAVHLQRGEDGRGHQHHHGGRRLRTRHALPRQLPGRHRHRLVAARHRLHLNCGRRQPATAAT